MDKYQEADIWLAEQMGECVHEWDPVADPYDGLSGCKCLKCTVWNPSKIMPRTCTPRSKDLGAMVNVADKIGYITCIDWRTHNNMELSECVITLIDKKSGEDICAEVYDDYSGLVLTKDHESPQHAAAWAIYLALREMKK